MARPKQKIEADRLVSVRLTADQARRFDSLRYALIGQTDHQKLQSLFELALRTAARDSLIDRDGHCISSGPYLATNDLIIRTSRPDDLPRLHELADLWALTKGR